MNSKRKIVLSVILIAVLIAVFFAGFMVQQQVNRESIAKADLGTLFQELCADETCYVIGHKSPDTDTVCSAILLADLLNDYGIKCEARISGKLNNETKFVLETIDVKIPEIMESADKKKMLLVDHSEYTQMIDGMKNAEIIAVFDHHSVGSIETDSPIIYESLNVGSTATVIYRMMKNSGMNIDEKAAYLIAAAILSDTNNLTSTTMTELDSHALSETAKIARIENTDDFYEQMKKAAESYDGMTEKEIFLSDYKEYDMSGTSVGIACINAADRNSAEDLQERMSHVAEESLESSGMTNIFVIVKNSADNQSTIAGYGDGATDVLKRALGSDGYIFKPAASRKKDVVPKLEKAYETAHK